ncbi:DUF86 domain-containing protein [Sedimentisphaera salicampi]|uniref:DUF86 domain-containing protein n=1 Tax=Sedimentisphaera salicampi TaxID=1941349 RepID=A0A1W6LKI5_9BACT|nr:HepT-like ribonuclease domain-containing protein [Sedimentisphaera salicampi]ARN56308.1 hypothetical protein STSP1_00684 [Sedimentisphaera salicampi]
MRDPRKYLFDIADSCQFLIEFTSNRKLDDYKKSRAFRSAVERELQIIGEAMAQLDRVSPQTSEKISEYRNIIAFRNIIVHGYDKLNPETVWDIIVEKIEPLLKQTNTAMQEIGE